MGTQGSESQGGDSTAHLHITGDHGEAQQESTLSYGHGNAPARMVF